MMQANKLEIILEDDGIIFLSYGGMLSQSLIVGMTDALEKESQINEMSMKVTNNLLTIFIELSQNMMNYSKYSALHKKGFDSKDLIIVGYDKNENYYYIFSRNILNVQDKEKIIPWIDQVLPLNKDELKILYRELRKSGKGKHDKGAGIGFVEIARRCDKIEYYFTKIDENIHSFSFKAIIRNT
ncbi:MAG: SiaB family protein kinase [gamma proteobacterium symbiont of Taylorina sp.]|nr:SiaB family protein kinase [gamma proteobacterium symbiont of Taylorina sp.]